MAGDFVDVAEDIMGEVAGSYLESALLGGQCEVTWYGFAPYWCDPAQSRLGDRRV